MTTPPIPAVWREAEEVFRPLAAFTRVAKQHFGDGEIVNLEVREDRSSLSHRHYFAAINEVWQNLPDALVEEFPTSEHLRKRALIKAGYRDERTVLCTSKAMAARVAAFVRPMDEYALVSVSGSAVVVLTAKSQSMRAMGKETFQASKDAVLGILADLIETDPEALRQRAKEAA